jgi:hypothetical protein
LSCLQVGASSVQSSAERGEGFRAGLFFSVFCPFFSLSFSESHSFLWCYVKITPILSPPIETLTHSLPPKTWFQI